MCLCRPWSVAISRWNAPRACCPLKNSRLRRNALASGHWAFWRPCEKFWPGRLGWRVRRLERRHLTLCWSVKCFPAWRMSISQTECLMTSSCILEMDVIYRCSDEFNIYLIICFLSFQNIVWSDKLLIYWCYIRSWGAPGLYRCHTERDYILESYRHLPFIVCTWRCDPKCVYVCLDRHCFTHDCNIHLKHVLHYSISDLSTIDKNQ